MSLEALDRAATQMAGTLVLVVGPSGVGKDTIMTGARDRLRDEPRIRFPRRVVTRDADGSEDHDTLDESAFVLEALRGGFILSWQAHGLHYGIPTKVIERLSADEVAVVNGSRTVVPQARRLLPRVKIVLVTAPKAVLAERLRGRGRDEDIEARLSRDLGRDHELGADRVIDNGGTVEAAVEQLCGFLQGC